MSKNRISLDELKTIVETTMNCVLSKDNPEDFIKIKHIAGNPQYYYILPKTKKIIVTRKEAIPDVYEPYFDRRDALELYDKLPLKFKLKLSIDKSKLRSGSKDCISICQTAIEWIKTTNNKDK